MKHPDLYKHQKVVILGLARSGQAVARLFHHYGADVVANDRKPEEESPEAESLRQLGITVICGHHPDDLIDSNTALVVKNPGIPYTAPPVQRALKQGVEVITEVEVAYHISDSKMVAITGSNGKTTTTSWIEHCFTADGRKAKAAGNIGTPLCEIAAGSDTPDWLIVELSSFQLKGTNDFRPQIACLLNVSETHLDYHGTFEDYVQSKMKIALNQTAEDTLVVNWDDPICRQAAQRSEAKLLPFSMTNMFSNSGVYLHTDNAGNEWIVYTNDAGEIKQLVETAELGIPGRHNVENALAAAAVSIAANVNDESIKRSLIEFRGVEHRLEFVCEKKGVQYYNNSKATNAAATQVALSAFSQPVILIAGGLERGLDLSGLFGRQNQHIKAVITLGETRNRIAQLANAAFISKVEVIESADPETAIQAAVEAAAEMAESGDVVLLSPACASWDMFSSFEERGCMFKRSVHNLV